MRRVVVAIVVVVWLVGAVGVLLQQGLVRFNHPGRDEFPVQGVDVSHHQRRIDWSALKRSGSQFAYIKATEGATFRCIVAARARAGGEGIRASTSDR